MLIYVLTMLHLQYILIMKFKHISLKFDAEGNFSGVFIESIPFSQTIMGIASDEGCLASAASSEWVGLVAQELDDLAKIVGEDAIGIKEVKRLFSHWDVNSKVMEKCALGSNKYFTGCILQERSNHSGNRFIKAQEKNCVIDLSYDKSLQYNRTLGYTLIVDPEMNGYTEQKVKTYGTSSYVSSSEQDAKDMDEEFGSEEDLKQFVTQYMRSLRTAGKNLYINFREREQYKSYTYDDNTKGFVDVKGKPLDYYALLEYMMEITTNSKAGVTNFLNTNLTYENGKRVTLPWKDRWYNERIYLQTVIAICACYAKTRGKQDVTGWKGRLDDISQMILIITLQDMMFKAKNADEKVDIIIKLLRENNIIQGNDIDEYIQHIKGVAATFYQYFLGNPYKKHYDELLGDFTDPKWDDYIVRQGKAPEDVCIRLKVADMVDTINAETRIGGIGDIATIKEEEILTKEIADNYKDSTQQKKKEFITDQLNNKEKEKDMQEKEKVKQEMSNAPILDAAVSKTTPEGSPPPFEERPQQQKRFPYPLGASEEQNFVQEIKELEDGVVQINGRNNRNESRYIKIDKDGNYNGHTEGAIGFVEEEMYLHIMRIFTHFRGNTQLPEGVQKCVDLRDKAFDQLATKLLVQDYKLFLSAYDANKGNAKGFADKVCGVLSVDSSNPLKKVLTRQLTVIHHNIGKNINNASVFRQMWDLFKEYVLKLIGMDVETTKDAACKRQYNGFTKLQNSLNEHLLEEKFPERS